MNRQSNSMPAAQADRKPGQGAPGGDEMDDGRARLAKMAGELEENRVLLADLQERLDAAQTELLRVVTSRSWRITAPLRKLGHLRGAGRLKRLLKRTPGRQDSGKEERPVADAPDNPGADAAFRPRVSIIVPNYNHAPFLRQRLASIDNQTYKNYEVILLDDCSTDGSRRILEEYQQGHRENTRLAINDANSGSPYLQWQKGLALARGDLVWIAESDDYCDAGFLESHVRNFADESVMLSFSTSIFVEDGKEIADSAENYADCIPKDLFRENWSMTAHKFVRNYFALVNIVVNVSSCVMRNVDFGIYESSRWFDYRLCGDWILYLHLISGGTVCHANAARNYYRIHSDSTSLGIQQKPEYFREHEKAAIAAAQLYRLEPHILLKNFQVLRARFEALFGERANFNDFYNIAKIRQAMRRRRPNIAMGLYAFAPGGGEMLPIALANGLKKLGYPVCVYDFAAEERNARIRSRLSASIPVFAARDIYNFVHDNGLDIFHTHHRRLDARVARARLYTNSFRHIVTMHGMYELMENFYPDIAEYLLGTDAWVYVGEGNIAPFRKHCLADGQVFTRIANAVEDRSFRPQARRDWNIPEDAFVFAICSRGIPEKGWKEAIAATNELNRRMNREVHLMIIGNGPVYEEMKDNAPDHVHFLGLQSDVPAFLSMADMLLLPSMFRGESFPMVILEAWQAKIPVLATNLGDIPLMLRREDKWAGELLELTEDGKIDVARLAGQMERFVADGGRHAELKGNVEFVAEKFDFRSMCRKYLDVYREAWNDRG